MRQVPTHRLRPNEKVWTPPHVFFFDTETRWSTEGPDEVHRLRCWSACRVDRRPHTKSTEAVAWGFGEDRRSLASWLNWQAKGRRCFWGYAHNLGFDLAVSALPDELGAFGWAVSDFAVHGESVFMRLSQGSKVMTLTDSWTWLPQSLESVASLMGGRKVDLPGNGDGLADWQRRCASDVELTGRAVLALMDWWDDNKLGRWTISGAGCGWNAMRHRETEGRHVISFAPTDEELPRAARWVKRAMRRGDPAPYVTLDRAAVTGGRRDAQAVRSVSGGPFVELDFSQAYATVAARLALPVKRAWTFDALPVDSKWVSHRFFAPVAECVVSTDIPRYPVRYGGVTWYPVGTFATTLCGPELAWARDSGHLVSIGAGQMHRLGRALWPWASWVLDPSAAGTAAAPPVALAACKTWGRSVLGKFAARSHSKELLEGAAPPGWSIVDSWDRRVGRKGASVTMGGRAWEVTYDGDGENVYPAVLAWVMSEVRVRLGRVLEALSGSWWVCDTDGLILDLSEGALWWTLPGLDPVRLPETVEGLAGVVCAALGPLTEPLTLRPKRVFDDLRVLGPQHLVAGGVRKMAGVSGRAVEVEPGRFVARDWPGLRWQMGHGEPGSYRRPERSATFTAPTAHRWVTDDGRALPVEFTWSKGGGNQLQSWAASRWADVEPAPTGPQYRLLERLRSVPPDRPPSTR